MSKKWKWLVLLAVCSMQHYSVALANKQEMQRTVELLPGFVAPPQLSFAIPSDYKIFPDVRDASEPRVIEGIIWSTPEVAEEYWSHSDKQINATALSKGAFLVTVSYSTEQVGPRDFGAAGEVYSDTMILNDMKGLFKDKPRLQRLQWGPYPLLVITSEKSILGTPFAMAYIGTNVDSQVIRVSYVFSMKKSNWKKDWQVWNDFIQKTTVIGS